jgi:hypothetical protein
MTNAEIAKLIRERFYPPDGKEPPKWTLGRDIKIWRFIESRGKTDAEISAAVVGVALLRDAGELVWAQPRDKVTLRCLIHSQHGFTTLWYAALQRGLEAEKRQPRKGAPGLGKVLRDIMGDAA